MAAYAGNGKLLGLLLEHTTDPNIQVLLQLHYSYLIMSTFPPPSSPLPLLQDLGGATATHLAAMEGNKECLTMLLEDGADANVMDHSDQRYM